MDPSSPAQRAALGSRFFPYGFKSESKELLKLAWPLVSILFVIDNTYCSGKINIRVLIIQCTLMKYHIDRGVCHSMHAICICIDYIFVFCRVYLFCSTT